MWIVSILQKKYNNKFGQYQRVKLVDSNDYNFKAAEIKLMIILRHKFYNGLYFSGIIRYLSKGARVIFYNPIT